MSGLSHRPYPWWEYFIPGVILLFGSIYVWWFLGKMEGTPDMDQLPTVIAYFYDLGGKWGLTLFVAGIGALLSAVGGYKLFPKRKKESGEVPEVTP